MGRNSLKEKRVGEILDALEICILNDSLQATSLEAIAKQANMKRSILRHYIGNREDIIICFSERWHQGQIQQWNEILSNLPKTNKLAYIIDTLFETKVIESRNDFVIADSIFFEIRYNERLKSQVKKYIDIFIESLSEQIQSEFSEISLDICRSISYGIYSLYFSVETFTGLNFSQRFTRNFKQATYLMLQGVGIYLK